MGVTNAQCHTTTITVSHRLASSPWNPPCFTYLTLLLFPQASDLSVVSLENITFSTVSMGILHEVDFLDCLLSVSNRHLRFPYVFPWLDHFFLLVSNIPTIWTHYSLFNIHLVKDIILAASSFGNYEQSCYKHSCAGFCVDISIQCIWVNTKEHDYRIIW